MLFGRARAPTPRTRETRRYVVIGALLGLMSHRRGLPLTMRSCFYPLWKEEVAGWRGDVVDVLSIACTLFGVCTFSRRAGTELHTGPSEGSGGDARIFRGRRSLGLGVRQLNKGLVRLDRGTYAGTDRFGDVYDGDDLPRKAACGSSGDCRRGKLGIDFDVKTQIGIVWCVTCLATVSVVAGLKRGIASLSYVAFSLGMVLLIAVLFMDDTMFILDAMTSSFGYYLWFLPKLSWETDAFARLGSSRAGRAEKMVLALLPYV